jgi:hypothetical protein
VQKVFEMELAECDKLKDGETYDIAVTKDHLSMIPEWKFCFELFRKDFKEIIQFIF